MEISGGLTVPWRYEVLSGGRWPWENVDDLGLCERGTQHQEKHCCVRKHDVGKVGCLLVFGVGCGVGLKNLWAQIFSFFPSFSIALGVEELFMFISLWTFHVHLPWHLSCFQPF